MPKNDWTEYKKLVLFEMQENGKRFEKITTMMDSLSTDVSGLKARSKMIAGVVGGAAGIIGTAVVTAAVSLWK